MEIINQETIIKLKDAAFWKLFSDLRRLYHVDMNTIIYNDKDTLDKLELETLTFEHNLCSDTVETFFKDFQIVKPDKDFTTEVLDSITEQYQRIISPLFIYGNKNIDNANYQRLYALDGTIKRFGLIENTKDIVIKLYLAHSLINYEYNENCNNEGCGKGEYKITYNIKFKMYKK